MISIDIEKMMRTYQGDALLKVQTEIAANSITKVYGPSGSGKTTLLKIIAGLIIPEKGKITVNGQLWEDSETRFKLSPQQRKVGFVFQHYALFPNMTVARHLQYACGDKLWTDRLLHFGKLETLAMHKPACLSGGQQQRLAILRALSIKPGVLLMDEPFSALDPEMRAALITDLKTLLTEWDCTCLIVSHNPEEINGICDGELRL